MPIVVEAVSKAEFDAWLAAKKAPATVAANMSEDRVRSTSR